MPCCMEPWSSTILSGGRRMTNSSTTRWRRSWGGNSTHGGAAPQSASAGNNRAVDAKSPIPAELGRNLLVRWVAGVLETIRWRRVEACLQAAFARGVLQGLQRNRDSMHDAAARRGI